MASTLSNQQSVIARMLQAEQAWDVDAVLALRSRDSIYNVLPASVGGPARNNDGTRELLESLKPLWSNFKIVKKAEVHSPDEHKAAVHILSTASTPVGPFEMESMWFITFTEDGNSITVADELVDSKGFSELLDKVNLWQEQERMKSDQGVSEISSVEGNRPQPSRSDSLEATLHVAM